jgi:hypothetical protein
VRETARFLPFLAISDGCDFYESLHHHPQAEHSPRQQSARQAVLEPPAQSLALSKCRPGASRLRPRHDVPPPSLLVAAWKSYMTSSRTTTSIYIAARIRVKLDMGGEITPWAPWQGSGRRATACWALTSSPGRLTPSSSTAAALGPTHARGETQTWLLIAAESQWGPHEWSVLSPTMVHRDGSSLSLHTGPFAGGLHRTGRGARMWRLDTRLLMGGKSEWGPCDRSALNPMGSSLK